MFFLLDTITTLLVVNRNYTKILKVHNSISIIVALTLFELTVFALLKPFEKNREKSPNKISV